MVKAFGMKFLSTWLLDVFLVATCFETRNDRVELRCAVDCYEMECSLPSPLVAAAAMMSRKKMKGNIDN